MIRLRRKTTTKSRNEPRIPDGVAPHSQAFLISERAVARGIEVTLLPDRRLQLRHDGQTHRFRSGWSTLNHPLARRCTAQKEVTSRLLREKGLPALENVVFKADDLARAWAWAERTLPVVVKPNAANKGKMVHVGVGSYDDFAKSFRLVAAEYGQVLIEEFAEGGDEHRFSVVDGSVIAVTKRVPPHVIGDGASDLSTLLELKNKQREQRNNPLHRRPITLDDAVLGTIRSQGLVLESVPAGGETVWLRRTSNISIGGEAVDRTDNVAASHVEMIEKAARAIPGLRLAGFDVLLTEASGEPRIIEVNPNPMLSMHVFPWNGRAREVYEPVLNAMFPATSTPRRDG